MPLLKLPEPVIAERRYFARIEEPLALTMERYAEFLGTDNLDQCREPGPAVHVQTRQPVHVLAGTEARCEEV